MVKAINLTNAKFWNKGSLYHLEVVGPSLEEGGGLSRQSQLAVEGQRQVNLPCILHFQLLAFKAVYWPTSVYWCL